MMTHVVGIDPGLVDTGVVRLLFNSSKRTLTIETNVVSGPDAEAVEDWTFQTGLPRPKVFIERYRPRQNLNADTRMVQAERDFRQAIPSAQFLPNTGVRKVAPERLMMALGLWKFKTTTHHQDLRSAARIAVLGMMKDSTLNTLLADVVRAHLTGSPWTIQDI